VVTAISDVPDSKFGRPGGPLASKTFIFVTLLENKDRLSIPTNKSKYQARGVKEKFKDNSSSTFQKQIHKAGVAKVYNSLQYSYSPNDSIINHSNVSN
jgi:hypothetical protein